MNRTCLSRLAAVLSLVGLVAMWSPIAAASSTEGTAAHPRPSHAAKSPATAKPGQPRPGVIRLEKRIAALRDQLAIAGAQRKPWRDFAAVLRTNEAEMYSAATRRAGRIRSANASENLRLYGLVAAVHAANVQRLLSAFEPLYDVLTPRQRKIADTILRDSREAELADGY